MKVAPVAVAAGVLTLCSLSSFGEKTPQPACLHYGGKLELKPLVYVCTVPCNALSSGPPMYVLYQDGTPIAEVPRPTPDPLVR
jgi:hypothetical protein